ncbi:hypothetical protein [Polyangium sp. 6x1]|uniref:hypothetical protein n=1 Tax=Polyangium sp. 6x1 TaxID=3042689 RepID=UPI00248318CC|nr:hypothetical protein [Polyangium sp. 6x1]MDI1445772.1 hypothetical protein [Polyangium sp. 6x1]
MCRDRPRGHRGAALDVGLGSSPWTPTAGSSASGIEAARRASSGEISPEVSPP